MVKYLTIVTYNKSTLYYAVTSYTYSNKKHIKLLYKFLKAFSTAETKAFVIRSDNVSSAVNELKLYIKTLDINEMQRKRLPRKSDDFYKWIIKE